MGGTGGKGGITGGVTVVRVTVVPIELILRLLEMGRARAGRAKVVRETKLNTVEIICLRFIGFSS
jgi:hypothetical protein